MNFIALYAISDLCSVFMSTFVLTFVYLAFHYPTAHVSSLFAFLGHARSLSKVSTASSLGTAEEVTCAFDETIAVAEEALQNELMDQMTKAPAKGRWVSWMTGDRTRWVLLWLRFQD